LPWEACGSAGTAWLVWTVRATAIVAISATTTAERNFALRDIIEYLAGSVPYDANNKIFALHKTGCAHIKLFNDLN
jgi:hypothetical protein